MSTVNDMAEMPVQLPRDPANAAEARSRYFNSGNAFNIKLPPVPGMIFTDEPARAMAMAETGFILCDQSDKMECDFPATTPLMLARYAVVKQGDTLDTTLTNTASIWYVIKGAARLAVGDESAVLGKGDVFLLPGGVASAITADEDSVFWAVGNDPQLTFDASLPVQGAGAAVEFVHYPAGEITHQLDVVYSSNTNAGTSGHALIFSAAKSEAARNITPEAAEQLSQQMKKLEGLITTPAGYVHEDVAFHDIIMRLSGDRLSKAIIDSIQSKALKTYGYSGRLNVAHVKETHDAHLKVYQAIIAGDGDAAARAMRDHIESSWSKRRPSKLG